MGNYGVYKTTQLLRKYIILIKNHTRKSYDNISILDCGCGTGFWTRTIANFLGRTDNVYGFEYSQNRLNFCKSMNPAIHYLWGDITEGRVFKDLPEDFDGIIAVDVLSQIRNEGDILKSLKNVYGSLSDNRFFLWYEINAKTHMTNQNKKWIIMLRGAGLNL